MSNIIGTRADIIALGKALEKEDMGEPGRAASLRTHPLYPHFVAAIEQAMYGKGERHGGARTDFLEQPWLHYAKLHGPGFLTGQAAKKLEEAASTKTGDAYTQELRGAIVYLGMALIFQQMQQEKERRGPNP